MIKKLTLFLATLAALSSAALAASSTLSVSVSYPSNPSASSSYTSWFPAGSWFKAEMSGVGSGGGVALAYDTVSGQNLAIVNTGGGAGQPFSGTNTSSPLSSGTTVYVSVHLAVDSAGAYGTSAVTANW